MAISENIEDARDVQSTLKPRMSTKEMFGDRSEIEIEHDGSIYRLRITKQGKLILNK